MIVTTIGSGVTSHNVVLNTGDILNVQSGGTADGTTVNNGGNANILLGGTANDTVVNLGGVEAVDGSVVNTIVNDGGKESLYSGGSATGTIVTAGGLQLVHTGGVARNTTVNNAGNQSVDGTTFNTTVNSGGTESLFNSSVANDSVVNNGGTEFIHVGSTTKGVTINSGGTVFLASGGIASSGITFGGGNAKLDISGTTMPATPITGFAVTDEIDLGGLSYAASNTVSVSGDIVTITGTGGASETLTIIGAQHDVFEMSAESDGDGGTKLAITSVTGAPVVSSPSVTVNGNTAATVIGIAPPTDPNYPAARLTIIAQSLPGDGGVLLADGVTQVTAGQSLTSTQLTSLLYAPTHGQFAVSSAFTYTVTDPSGNSSTGAATLTINPAVGNPVVPSTMLTVMENATATAIGIAAPTDPNYSTAQLTIAVAGFPSDGNVTLDDGVTAVTAGQVLTSAQLTGLLFTPTTGRGSASSDFTYTVTDPSNNASTGAATLAIGPAAPAFSTRSEIVNNATPMISGMAEAGGTVTLFSNGTAIGGTTADAATGLFTVTPTTSLALGLNTLSATVTTASGTSAPSAAISVFDVQAPVDGVSTTDFSSADLGAVLSQGATLAFVGGTEAVLLTDGTLSVGPDTNEATIQRLYEGLLGRASETVGMSGWDAQLTAGMGKAALGAAFLNSEEYMAGHGAQTDDQLVISLYQGVLGRAPDSEGHADWMSLLAQGISRGDVALGFIDSPEAKAHLASTTAQVYAPNALGTLLHELFKTGFGREIELTGLANLKAAFASLTPAQVAADITGSQEFMNDHAGQGNAAYVTSLYQAGLSRAPDAPGAAMWTGMLDNGTASRADELLSFATSAEGVAHMTYNLGA